MDQVIMPNNNYKQKNVDETEDSHNINTILCNFHFSFLHFFEIILIAVGCVM